MSDHPIQIWHHAGASIPQIFPLAQKNPSSQLWRNIEACGRFAVLPPHMHGDRFDIPPKPRACLEQPLLAIRGPTNGPTGTAAIGEIRTTLGAARNAR